jgi:plasmid maintenance system antidote protein VapI
VPRKGYCPRPRVPQVKRLGKFISLEMLSRGWTARRTAAAADLPVAVINSLLAGGLLTSVAAHGIGKAFGSSAELWLEAEAAIREQEIKRPW